MTIIMIKIGSVLVVSGILIATLLWSPLADDINQLTGVAPVLATQAGADDTSDDQGETSPETPETPETPSVQPEPAQPPETQSREYDVTVSSPEEIGQQVDNIITQLTEDPSVDASTIKCTWTITWPPFDINCRCTWTESTTGAPSAAE
jgi:hypothetical protein